MIVNAQKGLIETTGDAWRQNDCTNLQDVLLKKGRVKSKDRELGWIKKIAMSGAQLTIWTITTTTQKHSLHGEESFFLEESVDRIRFRDAPIKIESHGSSDMIRIKTLQKQQVTFMKAQLWTSE